MKRFALLFLAACRGFAAGPVMHLWVAEAFCEVYEVEDPSALVVGTEYPDIRYITRGQREHTHPRIESIAEVLEADSPFEMGVRLHAWVDIQREKFINSEIYAAVEPYAEGHPATLLKFIEEEVLADLYDGSNWSACFDEVREVEIGFANREQVEKWHWMVQWSLRVRPSWLLWAQSFRGGMFGVSAGVLSRWSYLLPQLAQEPLFKEHVESLLEHFSQGHLNGHVRAGL